MDSSNKQDSPNKQIPGGLLSKLPPVKNSPLVAWGVKYANVVVLMVCVLVIFGVYALQTMNKNEFPNFTIREGVVVAVYPGATSLEMEQQVLKPLENYVFSFKEVNKVKTTANATDGMVMIFVELDDKITDTDPFWNTFSRELSNVKTQLPPGVLAVEVISNFGDTSAILLTMESEDKTYRELGDYMDALQDRLRTVESVGTMTVYGKQNEQISILINPDKLSHYGINEKTLAATLFAKGFETTGGQVRSDTYTSPIYVANPLNSVADIANQIVFSTPGGEIVRLKDIAEVKREYPEPTSFITNNDRKCILLSIEMKKGNNIVEMGRQVSKQFDAFKAEIPEDVTLFEITNQPEVVNSSVKDFLRELIIAVLAVIIVIVLLLPLRVALIAAATIPITIFISLGLFYVFGIELNTVTFACLIVSLGMIVDNSVVIIDDYVELIGEGMDPKEASIRSGSEFLKAIFSATLAISITFFPFLFTMTGMFRDFLTDFPWAITLILMGSLLIAELLVPFLQYRFIKPSKVAKLAATEDPGVATADSSSGTSSNTDGSSNGGGNKSKKHFSLLKWMQSAYDKLIGLCFRHPWAVLILALVLTVGGGVLLMTRPMQLMPIAERNQFAVEIYLPTGTPLSQTNIVADSLANILRKDDRVVSVANFHGCSSPRFQTTYAPQVGGPNFAQFIVNTVSNEATIDILNEYTPKYRDYFPEAKVRFKQLSYSNAAYPVEVRLLGHDYAKLQAVADSVVDIMHSIPELNLVSSSLNALLVAAEVAPDFTAMSRLGLSDFMLEANLAMRYTNSGIPVATLWDGTYKTPVVFRTPTSDHSDVSDLRDEIIPVMGFSSAPLRQFADVKPTWNYGQLSHRNGIPCVTITSEVERNKLPLVVTDRLREKLDKFELPEGVTLQYGGDYSQSMEMWSPIISALLMAVVIIFFILLAHYKNVVVAALMLFCIVLCIPGAGIGLAIQNEVLSLTCTLGFISLMGILVRNVIIMIDYAEELQRSEGMNVKDAIFHSAERRMRPIFLTSAAASMGVLPMVLTGTPIWRPMGTVIFWGTIITFFFIVTVIPVLYWKVMAKSESKKVSK